MLDVNQVRRHFPLFELQPELSYLDSAATTLKPRSVIRAVAQYYRQPANVFRGIYQLSEQITQAYEAARQTVASFIGAQPHQLAWTSGTTAGINLVAHAWQHNLTAGDEIVVTAMEHHANLIPWQQLAGRTQAKLKIWPLGPTASLDLAALPQLITPRTRLLALTHVSNVLGTINPVDQICQQAKQLQPDIRVLVDGAQAVAHLPVDVNQLGCDWYVFSGHKLFGPTGIGGLWTADHAKPEMQPVFSGGEMITQVRFEKAEFVDYPHKLEPGTPHIAGALGLAAAIEFVSQFDWQQLRQHETQLLQLAYESLASLPGIQLVGPTDLSLRSGVIAFALKSVHPHDLAQWLNDHYQVAIRAGHHCAMPLHRQVLNLSATARLSVQLYNQAEDIQRLIAGVKSAVKHFSP